MNATACTYLRISLTDRCDFNCFYCAPPASPRFLGQRSLLTREEVLILARLFCRHGIRHIRLTGGEPLLRRDLPFFVRKLSDAKALERISLTTNGHRLAGMAADLARRGVTHVNVSLDTLRPQRFAKMTGRDALDRVLAGIRAARRALRAAGQVKVNVLLIRGFNDDETVDFVTWGLAHGVTVRFIEYFPTSRRSRIFHGHFIATAEVKKTLEARFGRLEEAGFDPLGGPAHYARLGGEGARVGFISSVTGSLCGRCNRLRLSADGKLYPCLHSDYNVDLAGPLRAGRTQEAAALIARAAARKKELNKFVCSRDFAMSEIGG
ncbi:MAG: GTP 3',8-cyclase MoaA [Deltaproteobacteria bacterium]